MDGFKLCKKCLQEKPVILFYRNQNCKDGYNYYCKDCQNEMGGGDRKRRLIREQGRQYRDKYFIAKSMQNEIVDRIKKEYWSGEWQKHFKIYN